MASRLKRLPTVLGRPEADAHRHRHHGVAWGLGWTHSVENIELRCRTHNRLAADDHYGAGFMAQWMGLGGL